MQFESSLNAHDILQYSQLYVTIISITLDIFTSLQTFACLTVKR